MSQTPNRDLLEKLRLVANAREWAPDAEPWDHGWCVEEYRRSSQAALTGPEKRAVRFTSEGVAALEAAFELLRHLPGISQTWEAEELWGVLATSISTLEWNIDGASLDSKITERIGAIVAKGPTFVAFEVANTAWGGDLQLIADGIIGYVSQRWVEAVQRDVRGRKMPNIQKLEGRINRNTAGDSRLMYGAWVPAQGRRARQIGEQRFDEIVSLALLLEPDPDSLQLYSLRGDTHRPGIRGLVIDRKALATVETAAKEAAAEIYLGGPIGEGNSIHWWGDDPFPLDRLLNRQGRRDCVDKIIKMGTNVNRRLRMAAAWYAKAHWSQHREDATLALGIALDTLIGDKSGLPSRVLADRFALLEQDRGKRSERAKRFGELYSARSSVAHGGRPSVIDEDGFVRSMAREVRWACRQVLLLTEHPFSGSEDAYREMFERLKWGIH